MQGARQLFSIICMILILIFVIVDLGVSITILVKFRDYGDAFRPQRGLASFNIVISLYGLIIGGFGLFSVLTHRGNLSNVVAIANIVLVIFPSASFISAIIIHSLAIDYVSSHFLNYMNNYENDQDSRNIVNQIQTDFDCCGSNTWLDWSGVSLNATGSTTSITATPTTTTGTGNVTSTTTGTVVVTNITAGIPAVTTISTGTIVRTATTTTTQAIARVIRNIETFVDTTESFRGKKNADLRLFNMIIADKNLLSLDVMTNDLKFRRSPSQRAVRRRRQTQSDYGGIYGLPLSFGVTLPESCCTNNLSTTANLANLYCISNANNISNNIHTDGCAKQLGKRAVGQTLALAVINSCLVITALAAIPALFETNPDEISLQSGMPNQPAPQYQQQYAHAGYNAPVHYPGMPYSNYNPTYAIYY